MAKDRSVVGSLINFRGLVYSPVNEQGVVFLFGRVLDDLNMYIEEVKVRYPDCIARRYTGKGWERVSIEFEFQSSNFIDHGHESKDCDIIVCWEDNLSESGKKRLEGIEIIELKSLIQELDNAPIQEPAKIKEKGDYDLEHHIKRKNLSAHIQQLYHALDKEILKINDEIFHKYAKTAITYYSPEKTFVYLTFQKNQIVLHIYTNQKNITEVRNIKDHENWGEIRVKSEKDFPTVGNALRASFKEIKSAIKENINTGWYAVTPKEKMAREKSPEATLKPLQFIVSKGEPFTPKGVKK